MTKDGKTIYAFTMSGLKADEKVICETFAKKNIAVEDVVMLNGEDCAWKMTDKGLEIRVAEQSIDAIAEVFKITLK